MKHKKYHRNISLVVFIATALKFFLLIVPLVLLFYLDGSVFSVINIIISILLVRPIMRLVWKKIKGWVEWIKYEKCDYESYRLYQEKAVKKKKYRNDVGAHLLLFDTYLVLGCYDECQKEINELDRLSSRISGRQAIIYGFQKIDYLLETSNSYPDVIKEINQITETFNKLEKISMNEKNVIQNSIMTREYLAKEKWEEVIALLKNSDNETIYEEVKTSYRLGKCYYLIGEYKQAFPHLLFVSKWGGNTKYVSLANDIIKSMPQNETYDELQREKAEKFKNKKWKIDANLVAICLTIVTTIFINYHSLYGSDMKEIYCKRYLCKEKEVTILYQQSYDNYEMVILSDSKNDKVAYCLFKKIPGISTPQYRRADFFRTNMYLDDHKVELERIGKIFSEDEKERSQKFYQETEIEQELWAVITGFYKKNRIFHQEDLAYVGVASSSMVENITINGKYASIEQITKINDLPVYLWSVENIDLKTNIQVDYAEQ